jgi:hypothetical protein
MHYLLTWNCTHIANAAIRSDIEDVCRAHGYEPPVLCTPEELVENLTCRGKTQLLQKSVPFARRMPHGFSMTSRPFTAI